MLNKKYFRGKNVLNKWQKVTFNINKNPHVIISLRFETEKVFSLFIEKILQAHKKIFKFAPTAFNSCIHTNHVWQPIFQLEYLSHDWA